MAGFNKNLLAKMVLAALGVDVAAAMFTNNMQNGQPESDKDQVRRINRISAQVRDPNHHESGKLAFGALEHSDSRPRPYAWGTH